MSIIPFHQNDVLKYYVNYLLKFVSFDMKRRIIDGNLFLKRDFSTNTS